MAAQGQAADDLALFNKSPKMAEVRNVLRISENAGNVSSVFSIESVGSSREYIFIATLLREQGYTVDLNIGEGVMIVKCRKGMESCLKDNI